MLVFTDGSHSVKPRMSGLGAVIIHKGKEHTFGTYTQNCRDNNVAEMAAIAMACKYIKDNNLQDKTINIISDSETALRKITRGASMDDEYEQECFEYIKDFLIEHPKVTFMHVKGHQTDNSKLSYYNRTADQLAGEYRKMGLELERTKPSKRKIKKYHKSAYMSMKMGKGGKHSFYD